MSEVSICNQALSWLATSNILSLTDGTTNANLCNANYAGLRDATLESASWTFATRRYILSPMADSPVYGYSSKFLIPSVVLRVIECRDNDIRPDGVSNLDWRREEDFIVSDSGIIYTKCIIRITDTSKFSPLFAQALAARIAATLAPTITEEARGYADRMWNLYENYMDKAVPLDGSQGKNDRIRGRSLTSRVR